MRHLSSAIAVLLLASACGSETPASGDGNSTIASMRPVAPPSGDEMLVTGPPAGQVGSTSPASSSLPTSQGNACGVSQSSLNAVPAIIELIVDTSKSMDDDPNPNDGTAESKWVITQRALKAMVPTLGADLSVGLTFYPGTGDIGNACFVAKQAAATSKLGALDSAARTALIAAIDKAHPDGGTPTEDAYRFGVERLQAAADGNKYLVLITDGIPTFELGCKNFNQKGVNTAPLIAAARDAAAKGIKTFVIGSPGSENARGSLSQLASVGGTAVDGCSDTGPKYCHFDMTQNQDLGAGLSSALGTITSQLPTCEYRIPTGQNVDKTKVNVLLKQGAETETVARDASDTNCEHGWQYSADGNSVLLCGETCDKAKANPGLQVQVLFGCVTARQPSNQG